MGLRGGDQQQPPAVVRQRGQPLCEGRFRPARDRSRRPASRSPRPAVAGVTLRGTSRTASALPVGLGDDPFPDLLVQRSA